MGPQDVSKELCDVRFQSIVERLDGLTKWIERLEGRMWALLSFAFIQLLSTLGGIIAFILTRHPG